MAKKKKPKFLRKGWNKYSKLGKRKKKKQVWRKPKGRDNKMREKRRGHGPLVKIGYKSGEKKSRIVIKNLKELQRLKGNETIFLEKMGKKKKTEIAKKAKEMKIKIENLNVKKLLKKTEKKEMKNKKVEQKENSKAKQNSETSSEVVRHKSELEEKK